MKKRLLNIVAVLLMVVMMICLTACGDDSDSKKKDSDEEVASSPKEVVEQFIEYAEKGKLSKASKLVDWTFAYKAYDDNYFSYDSGDDFYEELEDMSSKEIKKYKKEHDSDIEYFQESFEGYQSTIKDMASFKLDADVEKGKKADGTKTIYKVTANIKMEWKENKKDDKESSEKEIDFYVMETDGKYYLIDGVYEFRYLLSDLYW